MHIIQIEQHGSKKPLRNFEPSNPGLDKKLEPSPTMLVSYKKRNVKRQILNKHKVDVEFIVLFISCNNLFYSKRTVKEIMRCRLNYHHLIVNPIRELLSQNNRIAGRIFAYEYYPVKDSER